MLAADISDYQQGFDVDAYADAGYKLLIIKASEGATYRSHSMPAWRDRAHERGLFVWLYHFLRANPTNDEVSNFLNTTGGLRPNETAVCDWETPNSGFIATSDQAQAWLANVEEATQRRTVLYSGPGFLAYKPTANLVRWPLWVASYGPDDGGQHPWPQTDRWQSFASGPGSWPFEGRTVGWQYTSKGRVAGYGGELDVSRFDLSEADLAKLGGVAGGVAVPVDADPLHIGNRLLMEMP